MDDVAIPVGREVVAASDDSVLDLTVELTARDDGPRSSGMGSDEPLDKSVIRLRSDRRDAAAAPTSVYLESGSARQLAAALTRAADLAEELADPRR